MGSQDRWYRNFFWFQTGVSTADAADVGGKMIKTVIIWFAVLMALLVLVAVIRAIA